MKINNINIEYKKDFAIKQDVSLVFNSASGLLLMRTGTAQAIRKYSEKLKSDEFQEYQHILINFTHPIIKKYLETFNVSGWEPRKAQLSSFQKIIENNGPFSTGDVVLDRNWSKKYSRDVMHIVGMTYHINNGKLDVNKVTQQSLTDVISKGLVKANAEKYSTIAIPILCTRGDYGLDPKISLEAILDSIKTSQLNMIQKIIICFESEGPRKTFDELSLNS